MTGRTNVCNVLNGKDDRLVQLAREPIQAASPSCMSRTCLHVRQNLHNRDAKSLGHYNAQRTPYALRFSYMQHESFLCPALCHSPASLPPPPSPNILMACMLNIVPDRHRRPLLYSRSQGSPRLCAKAPEVRACTSRSFKAETLHSILRQDEVVD